MIKRDIILRTAENVKEFCKLAGKTNVNIDVTSGHYVIDGKSVLGLFNLDHSKVVTVTFYTDNMSDVSDLVDFLTRNNLWA